MRINGRHGSATGSAATTSGDMMEADGESLRERVSQLERRALSQADELVCLRATLADALRRLAALEARTGQPAPSASPAITTSSSSGSQQHHGTLTRNGVRGASNHVGSATTPRLRQPQYQNQGDAGSSSVSSSRDAVRRASSYAPSSLPQRRAVHYQSTGSLHSDSPSSSSASPVPTSPPPQQVPPPQQPQPPPRGRASPTASGLALSKRWSSTGDFGHAGIVQSATPQHQPQYHHGIASRLATKSLFNLHLRSQMQGQHQLKHGTRDASYNEEEGTVRFFLRGRPIILHAPSPLIEGFDLSKVNPAPHTRLKLEWVYGYRGRDCRYNLQLLPTGEMVYFVAAVVVLHNVEEQSQRHYLGHTDDVKSLCVHPNKLLVATGQTAGHDRREGRSWRLNPPPDRNAPEAEMWPHIRIWNSVSLATVAVIGIGEFERSICCLTFSKADGGTLLCAVDEAPDHNISIWDWQKSHRITETKCSADTVVAAEFHPLDKNSIVTCGKSHINFWTLDAGGTLYKRMGIFENRDKPKYVTCLAFTGQGDVVSGDSNGNVIVWGRGTNTISKFVRGVHEGSVFSICALKEGSIVTGGGKDGRLVQLDASMNPTGVEAQVPEHLGGVRCISEGRGSLLVGTTRSAVLTGALELGLSAAVWGHADELWGLARHPTLPQFATAGFDRLLHVWDSMSHSTVWSKDLAEPLQSAGFSPDGSLLVVGCVSGRWLSLDVETREVLTSYTDGNEPIQVVQFSPNGQLLALGSRDNNIYIYQVADDGRKFSRVGRCSPERRQRRTSSLSSLLGHSSYITHLDWSEDSQHIRSNSGDYELLYWNAGLCRQIQQSSSMRDITWATTNCTITFDTVGIWPEGADGTDVNGCCRAHEASLLATADDFGKVKLYTFPASQPKSLCHIYGGHSSHVTSVAFLHDDSRLVSTGGRDTSVMQWALV
ncbi:echinoderm microtubule-associated protein-like 2 isoform X2 [Schistocerca nitens]|uniref:echinoderm microtubule-associated protein-like 2 isoform X2 n=1 Tax=Schistocerca nitens TaxID=7011 RepID=UPI00211963B1|nr:echinoderm microtubule-associated protein-like 2 isoform X2 [Schistocerca nitens]